MGERLGADVVVIISPFVHHAQQAVPSQEVVASPASHFHRAQSRL